MPLPLVEAVGVAKAVDPPQALRWMEGRNTLDSARAAIAFMSYSYTCVISVVGELNTKCRLTPLRDTLQR